MLEPSSDNPLNLDAYQHYISDSLKFDLNAQRSLVGDCRVNNCALPCLLIPIANKTTVNNDGKKTNSNLSNIDMSNENEMLNNLVNSCRNSFDISNDVNNNLKKKKRTYNALNQNNIIDKNNNNKSNNIDLNSNNNEISNIDNKMNYTDDTDAMDHSSSNDDDDATTNHHIEHIKEAYDGLSLNSSYNANIIFNNSVNGDYTNNDNQLFFTKCKKTKK
jgi:hypothetical protein